MTDLATTTTAPSFRRAMIATACFLTILIGLWLLALLGLAVGMSIAKAIGNASDHKEDPRAFLPNYPDRAQALQIYRDQNEATREYRPFIEYKTKPVQTENLNVDIRGYRTHTAGKGNNIPNAVPIGFFGGSAMFGTGETDDNTIPAQFDVLTTDYSVTNYADLGWTGRQSLAQLINLNAEDSAPKVVIFYDGFNDVRTMCNRGVTDRIPGTSMERRFRALMERGRAQTGIYNTLVAPFMDLFANAKSSEDRFDYVCAKDTLVAYRAAEAFVKTWVMANDIVKASGGQFYGFLQPNIFTGKPRTDYLPPDVDNDGANSDLLRKEFDAVYPLIRQELAKTDLMWTDLSDAFSVDEPLFIDNSHVTVKGNQIIAQRIRDQIVAAR